MAQNIRKVKTNNSESNIYRLDQLILKIPKSALYHDNIIRSYYIGMMLNNLGCIVPNFVPILGKTGYSCTRIYTKRK